MSVLKRIVSCALAASMAIFMLAGCSRFKDDSSGIILKIGVSTAESDPRNIAAQQFADEITEKTGGVITAVVYPSGKLGDDAALIDMLALDSGKCDIAITDASNFATYEGGMGISALPFLFEDFDTAWDFMDSEVVADVEKRLLKKNMRVLAHYCNGFRCITNSKKTIDSPSDMSGMIIRTPENPVIMATMNALGANPQPLPFSEVYDALKKGTYDGQENPIPVIYNNKLYEVQKYLSVTNHIYSGLCFTIAESTWKKLSPDQQDIVRTAAEKSAVYDREMNREQTESYLKKLEDAGMIINEPDIGPFRDAAQNVLSESGPILGEVYDRLQQWLAER